MRFWLDVYNFFYNILGDAMRSVQEALSVGRGVMLLNGLWMTVQLSFGAIMLGLVIGSVIVSFKLSKYRILRFISFIYLAIIRGTPAVTQILIISVTFFQGFRGNRLWIGVVALGINSGAYVAEIIRAGILSIDKGQSEAGLSLGLNKVKTMAFVVMPQAVKNILPTLVNEFIVLIKETAIVGFVAITDLSRVAWQISSRTMNVTPLLVAAVMYLTLIGILTFGLSLLEKKLRAADRPR